MQAIILLCAISGLVANPVVESAQLSATIRGRDYWTWLTATRYSDPSEKPDAAYNPEIAKRAVFADCALHCAVRTKPPAGKPAFFTVKDNYCKAPQMWTRIEARSKPDYPMIIRWATKREVEAMAGPIELDYADYRAWKTRHPEVWGYEFLDEWDNDLISIPRKIPNVKDEVQKRALIEEWGEQPPTNRFVYLARARQYLERQIALHYGVSNETIAVRASFALDHVAGAWGAKNLWVEMTNTTGGDGEYRWDIAPLFTRGAARQFGVPWGWFQAIYLNGYTEGGEWMPNSTCWEEPVPDSCRPESSPRGGISASLERRGWYWAYVNGANGIEPEMWTTRFLLRQGTASGREELSARGRAFADFHDFTKAHPDRGTTFAPVAILTPFASPYPATGGAPWGYCPYERGDEMTDAVFFALVPGHARDAGMRAGKEFNLHNTRYAMMYDVLVPDSPQDPAAFAAALRRYPVAILSGDYPDYAKFASLLREYVRDGGTLVLNAAQMKGGAFSSDFTGVRLADTVGRVSGVVKDYAGRAFELDGEYELADVTPVSAETVLSDAQGRPLVTRSSFGRGRVIVTAPLWMAPLAASASEALQNTRNGTRTFMLAKYLLARFQSELFPVKVSGDVLYGLNRRKDGWWLWCFNNKGVTKFADAFERIDPSAKSRIAVDQKQIGAKSVRELVSGVEVPLADNAFAFDVPAGDLAIFEIAE